MAEEEYFNWNYLDDRAAFANAIFKLVYRKYNGDFNNVLFLDECKQMTAWLYDHVRNIYEVIQSEIPLMAYMDVLEGGADGFFKWGKFTDAEALNIIESYCHKLYG